MYVNSDGLMTCREQFVTFTKEENKEKTITHHAKIVTYVDIKKTRAKIIPLLTNDMEMGD